MSLSSPQSPRQLPLFALHTWLFPGVPLSLQVFEPRYLNMITRQLKQGEGFGIVAIAKGGEVGRAAQIEKLGVEVRVMDWNQQANGVLGLTVQGERRFRVLRDWVEADQLVMGEVDYLPQEVPRPIQEEYAGLVDMLEQFKQHPVIQSLALPVPQTTCELGWQLAQVLPFNRKEKAEMMLIDDGDRLLLYIAEAVARLAND